MVVFEHTVVVVVVITVVPIVAVPIVEVVVIAVIAVVAVVNAVFIAVIIVVVVVVIANVIAEVVVVVKTRVGKTGSVSKEVWVNITTQHNTTQQTNNMCLPPWTQPQLWLGHGVLLDMKKKRVSNDSTSGQNA